MVQWAKNLTTAVQVTERHGFNQQQWVKGSGVATAAGIGHSCDPGSIPGLGTFICHRCSHWGRKKKGVPDVAQWIKNLT